MIKLFMRMKIYFMCSNYREVNGVRDVFSVFWMNLRRIYSVLRFKIQINIIRPSTQGISYLTVDLRDICSNIRDWEEYKNRSWNKNYQWDKLKKHIAKYGLVKPIKVCICPGVDPIKNQTCKYTVLDGYHRLVILKKLYSSKYKVKIAILKNIGCP